MSLASARNTFLLALGLVAAIGPEALADVVVDFDDLSLAPNSHWNGPDPNGQTVTGPYGPVTVGQFTSHGASFANTYDQTYGSWSGFGYSNVEDATTPGWGNQFAAFAGSGHGPGADNYGVASGYVDAADLNPSDPASLADLPNVTLPDGTSPAGVYVTNTTYTAFSMLRGDDFAKKFGGASGNDPDYFKLTVYGTDAAGNALASSVDFYLADYRFADNAKDYVVSDWTYVDLSPLAGAHRLFFNLESSDVGTFGMNTPALFAMDDLRLTSVPEPSSLALGLVGLGLAGLACRRKRPA